MPAFLSPRLDLIGTNVYLAGTDLSLVGKSLYLEGTDLYFIGARLYLIGTDHLKSTDLISIFEVKSLTHKSRHGSSPCEVKAWALWIVPHFDIYLTSPWLKKALYTDVLKISNSVQFYLILTYTLLHHG